jgi:EAL domain-containing protein (putative c-di-GMP-specific phosphodiesterase class I)
MVNDPIDCAMVASINQIGHVMGMQTIAEYVKDDATLAALRNIGVEFAQGYGVGHVRSQAGRTRLHHGNLNERRPR